MCGIAAIFSLQGKKDLSSIIPMTRIVQHRGPDGEGIVFFAEGKHSTSCKEAECALGHRRLSIIDLSESGHQPMESTLGSLWITFNGEIYNYLEIKAELKSRGVQFKTETDTEVLLKAYETFGIHFLEKLNGMFSLVLIDRKQNKAYSIRDRFGVKPLYFCEIDGCLAFASEIKQFWAFPKFHAFLNHQRAYDFLNFALIDHTQETLYRDVFQVPGGHYVEIDLLEKRFSLKRWYQLPRKKEDISYEEAVSKCRALLQDAVSLRLRSDVEVGSCLSGGIDSSTIVCLASLELKKMQGNMRQKTFSARSKDPSIDEFFFMEKVREHSGVQGFYVHPQAEELVDSFQELLWHQDEPFSSTSVFAQWSLFSKVKQEGIKVMLDGQGADEQLGGYFEFYGIFLRQLLREGKRKALWKEIVETRKNNPALSPFRALIKHFIPHTLRDKLLYLKNKPSLKCPWINFTKLDCIQEAPFKRKESFREYAEEMLLYRNLPMLLHYEDRNSMAHSVESRTPFLDYRLVEFLFNLPPHFFIRQGMTKALLRDAMEGIVPKEVLMRKDKVAFATDERRWLGEEQYNFFMKKVESAVDTTGIFHPSLVAKCAAILQGKKSFSFLPFRIVAFGEWFRIHEVVI